MRDLKFKAWDKEKNKFVDAKWRMKIGLDGSVTWLVDRYDGNFKLIEREEIDGNDRFELI
ncbi:hypothetical protein [Clostridium thermarum]|uniref:hypothetical protein n=1 Tax=Clostridium thermarum TaxID=1716543 RepID=UPI001120E6C0|nr:hypothetical protein [Clostridium thermarum]